MEKDIKGQQLDIIRKRYNKNEYNVVHNIEKNVLLNRLSKVIDPTEFEGKVVMEIGAGCSLYLPLFLELGCKKIVANDLIEKRLKLNQINDERYTDVAGDFLETNFEDCNFDIIFAHLTLMFVIPMLDEFFTKIYSLLKPRGILITYDPNYLCPLASYFLTHKFWNPHKNDTRRIDSHNKLTLAFHLKYLI